MRPEGQERKNQKKDEGGQVWEFGEHCDLEDGMAE